MRKKNFFGEPVIMIFGVLFVLYFIGAVIGALEPRCSKVGCDNYRAGDSSYCYEHKPIYTHKYTSGKSYGSSSSGSSYGSGSTTKRKSTYSYSSGKSSRKNSDPYDSYDDGYDDVIDEGDYDDERYDRDSDYADGVDEAMEEEDW